jgi:cell division protein FtsA
MSEVIAGLDIGTSMIRIAIGQLLPNGSLRILGIGEAPNQGVTRGVITNPLRTTDAINQALEIAANQASYDIRVVNVNVSGTYLQCMERKGTLTRSSQGDIVRVEDVVRLSGEVEKAINSPGNLLLHTIPQEYQVGRISNIADPVGNKGITLEANFKIILLPEDDIRTIKDTAKDSIFKLQVEHKVFSPFAAALSTLTEDEKDDGVVLVDIGGGLTEIAIFYKNIVRHVAIIPYAGDNITADVQHACSVRPVQAELLKIKFGMALHDEIANYEVVAVPSLANRPPKDVSLKNISIAIEERLKEIASMVMAEIHNAGFDAKKLLGGIVLTGGTAQLPEIDILFNKVTGMYVRVGLPTIGLDASVLPSSEVKEPQFATAIGLVWRGVKEIDNRNNKHGKAMLKSITSTNQQLEQPPVPAVEVKPNKRSMWKIVKGFLTDDIGDNDKY